MGAIGARARGMVAHATAGSNARSLPVLVALRARAGPLGLFCGMRAKIVQSVLAAALLYTTKEKITQVTRELLLAGGSGAPAAEA